MRKAAAVAVLVLLAAAAAFCEVDRVPRPEFQSGYQLPELQTPAPRSVFLEYADVAALAVALAAAGWLALRARSREGIFVLGALSIAYFGFFRKGCVCPIGSIQNVALSLADSSYVLPVTVVAFFTFPLVATLLTGRVFCAGVCPFGALQDLVIVKPLRLPRWLSVPLGFLPVIYLGLAVLFAATGADFVVCRFDPFVSFFRGGGRAEILALGACVLVLGTVVARPYCRFVCPYGVVLKSLSRLSLIHTTISPDSCVQCRLCEEACPFDAIRPAQPQAAAPPSPREKRAFRAALAALPLLVALGAFAGFLLSPWLAQVHPTVRLARQVLNEDAGLEKTTTLESDTFRSRQTTTAELVGQAERIRRRFAWASPLFGGFVMLVLAAGFLGSFLRQGNTEHQPDRGECFSCGRCFSYCPREHLRLRQRAAGKTRGGGP